MFTIDSPLNTQNTLPHVSACIRDNHVRVEGLVLSISERHLCAAKLTGQLSEAVPTLPFRREVMICSQLPPTVAQSSTPPNALGHRSESHPVQIASHDLDDSNCQPEQSYTSTLVCTSQVYFSGRRRDTPIMPAVLLHGSQKLRLQSDFYHSSK